MPSCSRASFWVKRARARQSGADHMHVGPLASRVAGFRGHACVTYARRIGACRATSELATATGRHQQHDPGRLGLPRRSHRSIRHPATDVHPSRREPAARARGGPLGARPGARLAGLAVAEGPRLQARARRSSGSGWPTTSSLRGSSPARACGGASLNLEAEFLARNLQGRTAGDRAGAAAPGDVRRSTSSISTTGVDRHGAHREPLLARLPDPRPPPDRALPDAAAHRQVPRDRRRLCERCAAAAAGGRRRCTPTRPARCSSSRPRA